MKSYSTSLFLVLLLPILAIAQNENQVGSWKPIANVNDPQIQEIGKFAVKENNLESKNSLVYKRVVSGESQVVSGINYRLVIEVKDGSSDAQYQAVVLEKKWEHSKQLVSFTRLT
ncbi:cysteine proteinase inhibitor 5-like [Cucurbita maxima]|uniref:Cysteine proteinase inhibitor 5-like n=1 Tax=Cucurbita maxima TaxID=3661 RepID=A0A6J1I9P5_CUCMA|nr:cysteine proteinase inhibitor 5-like [Cucurbita maxima]XP_022983414.1 cysteine proteinase inhibitor 5-like [Cucurbita maxima]